MSWNVMNNWSKVQKPSMLAKKGWKIGKDQEWKEWKIKLFGTQFTKPSFSKHSQLIVSQEGSISPFTDSLANSRCCHGSLLRRSIEFESDPDFLQCTCQPSGQYFDFGGGGSLNHGSTALDVESSWNIISQKSHLTRCFNDFQWKRKLRQAKIIRYLTWSWMSPVKSIEVSKRHVLSIAILKVIRDDP